MKYRSIVTNVSIKSIGYAFEYLTPCYYISWWSSI